MFRTSRLEKNERPHPKASVFIVTEFGVWRARCGLRATAKACDSESAAAACAAMAGGPSDIVFTGYGVCCNLGDDLPRILDQLRHGRNQPFSLWPPAIEYGGRCQLVGLCDTDLSNDALSLSSSQGRFMGRAPRLALKAARQAVAQSACDPTELAVLVGSGVGDCDTLDEIREKLDKTHSMRRVAPTVVPRLMASTVSANLSTVLAAKGPSCSLTAACAGGAYNMVMAALLLQSGSTEIALAGGVDVAHLAFFAGFDSMRAYNAEDNDRPERASRPYAADRGGFIFGEGAGVAVLERREHAQARGANILGVLRGFGMSSDGTGDMVAPSSEGGLRAMKQALRNAQIAPDAIDYINTHGTSTPLGDVGEVRAIRELLSGRRVAYSSTKGYTGHTVSGAGAIEAIFSVEMLRQGWLAPCIHAEPLDPELADYPPVLQPADHDISVALSNSFGFGGTNVSLVLERA